MASFYGSKSEEMVLKKSKTGIFFFTIILGWLAVGTAPMTVDIPEPQIAQLRDCSAYRQWHD